MDELKDHQIFKGKGPLAGHSKTKKFVKNVKKKVGEVASNLGNKSKLVVNKYNPQRYVASRING